MKLFLWNDHNWKLVDENMDDDSEDYVVAKKLIVRWLINVSNVKLFSFFGMDI